jgi:RluA family pseudouridine synthase
MEIAQRIIIEDEHLVAVRKLAGELVVKDRFGLAKEVLLDKLGDHLREKGHQPDESGRDLYPVHRLDRDTSGLVLFAKHEEAHRRLSKLFEGREMEKTYWLFSSGVPLWDEAHCCIPLVRAEGKKGRGRALVDLGREGKETETRFKVRQRFEDMAWVVAQPRTGRLHQIRLHMRLLGHPVWGDPLYGNESDRAAQAALFPRLALHARELAFRHPFSGAALALECSLDEDFRSQLNDGMKKAKN